MKYLDRSALTGMALGVALILQPWWEHGFRVGFFLMICATALHIYTSHANRPEGS